jgi:precorrin-6A/cobalt-precorrin-6A reductase
MRILILGGTSEASALARRVAGDERFSLTLSLAGRTMRPKAQPLPMRSGGFGGTAGLERWLRREGVSTVIDATHPYAVRISANAVAACASLGIALASIVRPPWVRQEGDRWIGVDSATAAAGALGDSPARVFLSLGRLELAAFTAAPQHDYIARTIDPPGAGPLPPSIRFVHGRGPFDTISETAFLARERIDIVVSKNSGGEATYAKVAAARSIGIPVVMIARPAKPAGIALAGPEAALRWLEERLAHEGTSNGRRGV